MRGICHAPQRAAEGRCCPEKGSACQRCTTAFRLPSPSWPAKEHVLSCRERSGLDGSGRPKDLAPPRPFPGVGMPGREAKVLVTRMSTVSPTAHHAPCRLRRLAEAPQEDRGALRLGQDRRRHGADDAPRRRTGPRPVHSHHGGVQPGAVAPPPDRMTPGERPSAATPKRHPGPLRR